MSLLCLLCTGMTSYSASRQFVLDPAIQRNCFLRTGPLIWGSDVVFLLVFEGNIRATVFHSGPFGNINFVPLPYLAPITCRKTKLQLEGVILQGKRRNLQEFQLAGDVASPGNGAKHASRGSACILLEGALTVSIPWILDNIRGLLHGDVAESDVLPIYRGLHAILGSCRKG